MGKFMIIFPRQITAEQMGLSFEVSFGRIILHLAKNSTNFWKKTAKNLRPNHTHRLQFAVSSSKRINCVI